MECCLNQTKAFKLIVTNVSFYKPRLIYSGLYTKSETVTLNFVAFASQFLEKLD